MTTKTVKPDYSIQLPKSSPFWNTFFEDNKNPDSSVWSCAIAVINPSKISPTPFKQEGLKFLEENIKPDGRLKKPELIAEDIAAKVEKLQSTWSDIFGLAKIEEVEAVVLDTTSNDGKSDASIYYYNSLPLEKLLNLNFLGEAYERGPNVLYVHKDNLSTTAHSIITDAHNGRNFLRKWEVRPLSTFTTFLGNIPADAQEFVASVIGEPSKLEPELTKLESKLSDRLKFNLACAVLQEKLDYVRTW